MKRLLVYALLIFTFLVCAGCEAEPQPDIRALRPGNEDFAQLLTNLQKKYSDPDYMDPTEATKLGRNCKHTSVFYVSTGKTHQAYCANANCPVQQIGEPEAHTPMYPGDRPVREALGPYAAYTRVCSVCHKYETILTTRPHPLILRDYFPQLIPAETEEE